MIHIADNLQIEPGRAVGQRIAAIGKSGSGKTTSLLTFAEEWLGAGWPLTFLDPMAEALALPASYPVVLLGRRKTAHLEITSANAAQLAEFSVKERVSFVLDMSLYSDDESMEILEAYLGTLWRLIFAQDEPQPYALVIDEAHIYAPQSGTTPLSKTIIDVAKRGRHKHLTTMVATQRAASIVKDFLTQATLLIAHRLSMGIDTKVLREQLPLPEKELNGMMRKLKTGQALVIGEPQFVGDEDYILAQVRRCYSTKEGDAQPLLPATARPIDEAILTALQALAATEPEPQNSDTSEFGGSELEADLRHQIADLKQLVDEQRLTIATLTEGIDTLEQRLTDRDNEVRQSHQQIAEIQQRHDAELEVYREKLVILEGTKLRLEQVPLPLTNGVPQIERVSIPSVSVVIDESQIAGGDDYRSPLATTRAVNKQERTFDALLSDLRLLVPSHRALLHYLLKREDLVFTIKDLARYMGYSEKTLRDRPPLPLIEMGLVQRTGGIGHFRYGAGKARETLKKRFPDLDEEKLVERLLTVR